MYTKHRNTAQHKKQQKQQNEKLEAEKKALKLRELTRAFQQEMVMKYKFEHITEYTWYKCPECPGKSFATMP